MLQEIKDSLFNEIQKRIKNPFLGAFILSWVFCNWDFIYVTLFLDEKYVSLIPTATNTFFTKYEYIKTHDLVNVWKFLIYPLISSFIIVFFIEWVTTATSMFVNKVKNLILGNELLTKEDSLKFKSDLIKARNVSNTQLGQKNDEILSLQGKVDELESKIEDKVSEKLKLTEGKNLQRIGELKDDLLKSEIISSERLEKNKRLDNDNKNLNKLINTYKQNELDYLRKNKEILDENGTLKAQNIELQKRLSSLDRPLDENYKIEYEEFKKSHFFSGFENFIDEMETNSYDISNRFLGKDIMYLKVKGIISEFVEDDSFSTRKRYEFTQKGNKFVEYFLDNYSKNKVQEEISVEDIPF